MSRPVNSVVHPLPFPARGDDPGPSQVREMARNLGLALAQDLDEVTDADFAAVHQVEQTKARAVRQCGEERCQVRIRGSSGHERIIYMP